MKPLHILPLLAALIFPSCTQHEAGAATRSLIGAAAPDFSLKTLTNAEVKLSDQKGKVVLLDVWATWCPPCLASLPHLQQVSADKKLADQGLVVWAIDGQEKSETVETFLQKNNYTFTVPMNPGELLKQYKIVGIPTTIIIGRDGLIKEVFVGFGKDSAKLIDDALQKALAETAPTLPG